MNETHFSLFLYFLPFLPEITLPLLFIFFLSPSIPSIFFVFFSSARPGPFSPSLQQQPLLQSLFISTFPLTLTRSTKFPINNNKSLFSLFCFYSPKRAPSSVIRGFAVWHERSHKVAYDDLDSHPWLLTQWVDATTFGSTRPTFPSYYLSSECQTTHNPHYSSRCTTLSGASKYVPRGTGATLQGWTKPPLFCTRFLWLIPKLVTSFFIGCVGLCCLCYLGAFFFVMRCMLVLY
jgi:hypothetical protein